MKKDYSNFVWITELHRNTSSVPDSLHSCTNQSRLTVNLNIFDIDVGSPGLQEAIVKSMYVFGSQKLNMLNLFNAISSR
jgi:hypothetical protein